MSTRKPIRVFYSAMSGRFYATPHYRETPLENGIAQFEITGRKDDVTDDIGFIAKENGTDVFTDAIDALVEAKRRFEQEATS